jgi:SAM-dependent methyltransferase
VAYAEDLAHVHDVGFGGFAAGAAPGILGLLRRAGISSGLVVDLGCGSGVWARTLVEAGYDALGVDISQAMIALARRRAPGARFRRASAFRTPLPRCRAVTALGETLGYRFDDRAPAQLALRRLLGRVHAVLEPGGLFVFDLCVTEGRSGGSLRIGFREERGWAVGYRVETDLATRTLTREITTFRRAGRQYRRRFERHRVQLYRAATVSRWLRQAGFSVRVVRRFGDQPLPAGVRGFVARKLP